MRFAAFTTFPPDAYEKYGKRMLQTFDRYWPGDIPLYVYWEGAKPEERSDRIFYRELYATCPDLVAFKKRNEHNPHDTSALCRKFLDEQELKRAREKFRRKTNKELDIWSTPDGRRYVHVRYAGIKFAHMSYCTFHATTTIEADYIMRADSDSVTYKPLPHSVLERICPPNALGSYFSQRNMYPEIGWLWFNAQHPLHRDFIAEFKRMYDTDEIYNLPGYNDAYVFDHVRQKFEDQRGARFFDITTALGLSSKQPFITSPLAPYVAHHLGVLRKEKGGYLGKDLAIAQAHRKKLQTFLKRTFNKLRPSS